MAGLLDSLFPSSDGGGLLDWLKSNAQNQAMPAGLPSDTAQYGAPQAPQQQPAQGLMPQAPVPQNPPPVIRAPQAAYNPPAAPQGAPGASPSPFPASPAMAQPGAGNPLSAFARAIMNIPRGGADDPAVVAQQQQQQTLRANYQALVSKGVQPNIAFAAVQPGNAELFKSVWDQANSRGSHTQETDKNGNIWDVDTATGKKTLSLAGDKTPTDQLDYQYYKDNFKPTADQPQPMDFATFSNRVRQKPADQQDYEYYVNHFAPTKDMPKPMDFATFSNPTMREQALNQNGVKTLVKGNVLYQLGPDGKPQVLLRNDGGNTSRMLSDDGVDLAANRLLSGEKGVLTGFARSPGDLMAVQNRVAALAKERHIDASDILANVNNQIAASSASRTFGGMTAKQETYSTTAGQAINIAEKASEAVPRTTYPDVNKAILAYRNHTGDPKVAALGQALETLTQEYARAVGGGHGTVADKEEAREYLSKAQSHDQLVARLNVMRQEIARARAAVGESAKNVGDIYKANIRGGKSLPEPGTKDADELAVRAGSTMPEQEGGKLPEPAATPPKLGVGQSYTAPNGVVIKKTSEADQ